MAVDYNDRLIQPIQDKLDWLQVTADGYIVHNPPGCSIGLLVLSARDGLPILQVNEVSDDKIVNIFLHTEGETSGIRKFSDCGDGPNDWQILAVAEKRTNIYPQFPNLKPQGET